MIEGGMTDVATAVPGVHAIQLTRVFAHLVDGDPASLIDTGYAGSTPAIERALSSLGGGLGDVARVVCTHGHPDHAGSAQALADRGIEVFIHPADAERMRIGWGTAVRHPSRGRLFAAMTPPLERFTPLDDGDVLPMLGGLRVIHTPGHTPGSVCLYGVRDRTLFVGDALQRRGGKIGFASALYSDDRRAAERAVKRLAELDVEVVVFSHYPPINERANELLRELAGRIRD
jgi:glyoxylase-like metal-dependent hydrolase (beta-lactamase superfamily II)